ncbi:MAG TPA: acyl-ACP--UDP-N-acetylglucosamine O-acyltransferase [Porticoccaceae bacterium]|jgi:UDP-N-acetylglucosamine acyltransferase|nr:acyl-ACP--UDP-N-acetylglucosamine O-acyltransferase [Gammaproteobacteria bacterium]HIL59467.1 acyl-ACP--UDP-N-acetylglucosamine O-acyltransferase [Porticoccaceae bacterium]
MIDETSKIDPKADISSDAVIGPWCVIGPNVFIGPGTVIESSVIIRSNTKIGSNNRIFQFSSVGEDPADKKFTGEETWLEIGDNNIFREGVTLHRGTGSGGCLTKIGSDNLMMPYVHVAHDCIVGDNTVFANNAAISGHVVVGDWVILGGYAGVNQFLKIGDHAMIGAMSHITNDIPAYVIVSGRPASVRSINAIGLERRGFDKETVADIREAFKIIYKRNYSLQESIDQLKAMSENCKALEILISSLESSEKGIHR